MDPALPLPVVPWLAPMRELAGLDPSSSEFHFLWTKFRRQRSLIEDALLEATKLIEQRFRRSA
ncbi:MAG: hypothetical protein M3R02_11395 [Chloroflexota bacterium]|nr:hypothetical protein [Chloroflexota bacterium]